MLVHWFSMERRRSGDQNPDLFTFVMRTWIGKFGSVCMNTRCVNIWNIIHLHAEGALIPCCYASMDYPLRACIIGAFSGKFDSFKDTFRDKFETNDSYILHELPGEILCFSLQDKCGMNHWILSCQDRGLDMKLIFSTEIYLVNEQENQLRRRPQRFFASGLIVSGCQGTWGNFFGFLFSLILGDFHFCTRKGFLIFLIPSVSRKVWNQERKTKSRVWLFFLFCCLIPFLWELDFLLDRGSSKRGFYSSKALRNVFPFGYIR